MQRLANGTAQTKTQTKIKIGGVNHRYEFTSSLHSNVLIDEYVRRHLR